MESSPVARSQSIWLSNFISYHVNKSQIKEIEILLSVLKVICILMPQTDPGLDIEAGSQSSILKWEFLFLEITSCKLLFDCKVERWMLSSHKILN